MWTKIIDPHISRRWLFEDLYQKQASLMINSTKPCYSDCVHGPPSTASSRWVTDVKAKHLPRGGRGGRWHPHDHWCV